MILILDGTENGEVEVLITYVVTKARWTPKYDIRVFSNDAQLKVRRKREGGGGGRVRDGDRVAGGGMMKVRMIGEEVMDNNILLFYDSSLCRSCTMEWCSSLQERIGTM